MHPETNFLSNINFLGIVDDLERAIKKEVYDKIIEHNSKYYLDKEILKYAMIYKYWCELKDDNSIFFPNFIDWRGRIYCAT